ncbi:MAG: cytochrome b [Ahniella sp.]|nr:cytochrome b [Ahniella sp.]
MNREHKWPIAIQGLHWLMAALLIVQWASGEWDDWLGVRTHVSLGLLVLMLAVLRLVARLALKHPPATHAPTLPDRLASFVHVLFYVIMFLLPISGILWRQARGKVVSFFDWFNLPSLITPDKGLADFCHETHEILALVFLVLLGVHVAGALKRQWIDRQPILSRMWP